MQEQHTLERAVLDDIRRKTGLSFLHIAGIDTQEELTAQAILPMLRDWLPSVTDQNCRNAIFHRFVTPHASPYVESLLEWWQAEEDKIGASLLTQALVAAVKLSHAPQLWRLTQELPGKPFHFMLLAKLATFPNVATEVKDSLVQSLDQGGVPSFELVHLAKVDDSRIRRWFENQVESPDVAIRQLARRVAARGRKLPPNVEVSPIPPDRSKEIFSTEVDLADLRKTLGKIEKQLDVKISTPLKTASFLSSIEVDQWVLGHIKAGGSEPIDLWFRLEDIDTVEILIARPADRGPLTVH